MITFMLAAALASQQNTNVDIFIHSQTTPIIQRATEGCPGGGTDKPPPPPPPPSR